MMYCSRIRKCNRTNKVLKRSSEMQPDMQAFQWTRQPESYLIAENRVEIVTKPHTDLWQRTYYGFRNDNAPVLQMRTAEKYF